MKIIDTILVGGIATLIGAGLYTDLNQAINKQEVIRSLMQKEFDKRYKPSHPVASDAPTSKLYALTSELSEMKYTFINGEVIKNPYYASKTELERLAKEGKQVRDSLEIVINKE